MLGEALGALMEIVGEMLAAIADWQVYVFPTPRRNERALLPRPAQKRGRLRRKWTGRTQPRGSPAAGCAG